MEPDGSWAKIIDIVARLFGNKPGVAEQMQRDARI